MAELDRYLALVRSFPVMRFAPARAVSGRGIDFHELEAWAMAEDVDGREGILVTVQFLLNLWSASHPWACGKFDLFAALNVWDDDQLAAWQAWAAKPWRP